jgi:hypothetical protein
MSEELVQITASVSSEQNSGAVVPDMSGTNNDELQLKAAFGALLDLKFDMALAALVRRKFTSGNSVQVDRITIKREELEAIYGK